MIAAGLDTHLLAVCAFAQFQVDRVAQRGGHTVDGCRQGRKNVRHLWHELWMLVKIPVVQQADVLQQGQHPEGVSDAVRASI